MTEPYTFKDFVTGKIRRTRGKFIGWSNRTGKLNVPYATFKTPKTFIHVPFYLLTKETKERLPPRKEQAQ